MIGYQWVLWVALELAAIGALGGRSDEVGRCRRISVASRFSSFLAWRAARAGSCERQAITGSSVEASASRHLKKLQGLKSGPRNAKNTAKLLTSRGDRWRQKEKWHGPVSRAGWTGHVFVMVLNCATGRVNSPMRSPVQRPVRPVTPPVYICWYMQEARSRFGETGLAKYECEITRMW